MKQHRSFVEWGMIQWRIVLSLALILVALGVQALLTMPRQEFPDFTIRQGVVVGVMPGATSKEVEERVAKPVEEYLFGFNEVDKKKTYSVSSDGQVVVFVELRGELKGPDAPAFWAKLRHGLNELKAQRLPGQVLALVGNNDFGDTSALLFTVVADGRSPRDLDRYVETLQTHLRRIGATSKVRTYGTQQEVIRVTLSRDRLARTGVRPALVWSTLQGLGGTPAPARLDLEQLEMPIHVQKVLRSEAELGDTILLSLPTGAQVRLKDVAEIKREYGHDDAFVRYNGKTAVVVSIEMQSGNDITRFGEEVDRALADARRELPPGVLISRVADQPKVVKASVGHFLRDFGLAIGSVILVMMLLLPLRMAAVAAISIPICIAMTLAVLNAFGVQLQTVSLAGLIVVLGMVVDNAIVVIDDHIEKLDRGLDAWSAAWKSARELTIPVLTATVAIILSYVPMPLFLTGTAGDFIGSLPMTVGVALVISMLVSVLLVPVMNWRFIRRGLRRGDRKRSFLDRVQSAFDRSLEAAFRHPALTLLGGAATVVAALVIASRIPQQPFPKVDRNQFAVEVYLPSGRSLAQTDQVVRRLEAELMADKRVINVTAFVGQSSPRFHTVYAPHMPARNYGQLLVNTVSDEATLAVLRENEQRLSSAAFPEAWIRWKQLELNLGSPVEVRLVGNDIRALKETAALVKAHARSLPGVTWVRDDYEEALQTVEVVPNADACAQLGVPPAMLQASLALGSQGLSVGTIWEDDYPVKVLVQDEERAAKSIEGLRQQYVSSMMGGASVQLEQLATVRPAWNEGAIVRRNGVRTLTVSLDIGPSALASQLQQQMESFIGALPPSGVRIEYGGEKELAGEVFVPMSFSMAASIGFIALVLLFQFQRFRKVVLVMLAMPLSLLGAFVGLVLARYPFSMTGFIGIIGLLGIVVRNGVILVTYAEELRRDQGMNAHDAGLAAGKRRMRPICLTSLAAAIGVIPMIISRSTLWGPLGTVTCFGLLVAMVITLLVLPVAYWQLTRGEEARAATRSGALAATTAALILLSAGPVHAGDGPYTLARCRELALKNSAQVQEAQLEIEASMETKDAAYTRYFPQVSASATGLLAAKPLVQMQSQGGNLPVYDGNPANIGTASQFAYMPGGSMEMARHLTVFSLSAAQPIYAGGRISKGNELAALGVQVAEDRAALSRRDAVAQTEEKYWRLTTLREKLHTLAAYERLLDALDRQVTDGVKAGFLTQNDRLKVRLKWSEARADRARLENGLRLASRDLRHHIGLPDGDVIELADGLETPQDPAALAGAREGSESRRIEIRLLESAVRAERLQTSMKRGEMLPSISVGAMAYRADVSGMPGTTNALVFGTVSLPLSELWGTSRGVASQRRREIIAQNRLTNARELIGLEVEKTWQELQAAWNASVLSDESVRQADVNLNEVSDRHANGLVTFSDVLEAQVLRQQSLDRRLDARGHYWLERSAFLRAVGRAEAAR